MNIILIIIDVILFILCILFILKIYFIKKSFREIEESLKYILNNDTNNIITISCFDKDIKKIAINLNKNLIDLKNERLKYTNGNRELKNTIVNISHDLRTPLTAINSYIDLLNEEELNEKQKKYLETVQRKTDELIELTKQLFNYSTTTDKVINLEKEKCCINEILENTLISYYQIFKEKQIIPEISICKEKIYKFVNKATIIRVFENIISNIFKYTTDSFKVEMKRNGTIIFSNDAPSLNVTTVQKIFNRYFSVENARESTGIGLSIAKQLIELNNGSISAEYVKNTLYIRIDFNQENQKFT